MLEEALYDFLGQTPDFPSIHEQSAAIGTCGLVAGRRAAGFADVQGQVYLIL